MKSQDLKKSILQYAMQGKLVAQDPNDEPASELLKRIKAEKEQLIKDGKIKKEKPLLPITKGEIPYNLPQGWEWVRLGNIFNIIMGQSPDGESVSNQNNGIEFHQGKVFFSDKYIKKSDQYTTKPTKIAIKNSVLLCVRAPVGIVNITNREICIGRGLCAIENNKHISILFTYYLLKSLEKDFVLKASGTTFIAITGDVIKKQIVPLPPLAEQKRIVEKLEEILPLVDEYGKNEEILSEMNQKLPKQIRQSILQYAVQGKLVEQNPQDEPASELLKRIKAEKEQLIKEGKIKKEKPLPPITQDEIPYDLPQGWQWVRLGDIGDWGAGSTPNRARADYYLNGTIPWLKTGDLNDGFITEIPEKITELALKQTSVKIKPIGSLLIAMYGATIGKLGILTIPATTNQACCACIAFPEIETKFLFYYLLAERDNLRKRGDGGAQPNISREKIIAYLLPLPPLAEQKRIVAKVEELLNLVNKLEEKEV